MKKKFRSFDDDWMDVSQDSKKHGKGKDARREARRSAENRRDGIGDLERHHEDIRFLSRRGRG
jgi:hypothetical protein